MGLFSFFSRDKKEKLDKGLFVTKQSFISRIAKAILGKTTVDHEVLASLEEILISSDIGVDTSIKIIERVQKRMEREKNSSTEKVYELLKDEISELLTIDGQAKTEIGFDIPAGKKPYVIMVVGVNGVGKTTKIGKLAHQFKSSGKSVLLGAADTFRAAAIDQLTVWSKRVDVPLVSQGMNADPASVAFDTIKSAITRGSDVVIIDTAGRLHNKVNLMNELGKIKKVMQKLIPDAPHEILLVLDGSTGQNAIEQCKQFTATTQVNALAITKLDGTAKGGVVIAIVDQFKIPVKYIGVGEQMDDLQPFNGPLFAEALFNQDSNELNK